MNIQINVSNNKGILYTGQVPAAYGEQLRVNAADFNGKFNYELLDTDTGFAPQQIISKRVGDDLQITFENNSQPSLVIEDYYQNPTGITGLAENGKTYSYIPQNGLQSSSIEFLGENVLAESVLGGSSHSGFSGFNFSGFEVFSGNTEWIFLASAFLAPTVPLMIKNNDVAQVQPVAVVENNAIEEVLAAESTVVVENTATEAVNSEAVENAVAEVVNNAAAENATTENTAVASESIAYSEAAGLENTANLNTNSGIETI